MSIGRLIGSSCFSGMFLLDLVNDGALENMLNEISGPKITVRSSSQSP